MPLYHICPILSRPLLRIFLLPPTVRAVVGERGQYVSKIFKCVVCFREGLVALEFLEFGVDCSEVGWCEGRLLWGLVQHRGLFKRGEVGHLEGWSGVVVWLQWMWVVFRCVKEGDKGV